ncbi:MAG: hypothetical protein RL033_7819 [Pseudomonadota bacterium]|jgi:hypothetical protein
MAWRVQGRLMVVVHCAQSPSNLEWEGVLRDELQRVELGHKTDRCTLVVTYGGGPDGDQRKRLAEQMDHDFAPTCIMTKSTIVRGIVAALTFFNRRMKIVGLEDREAAFHHLGLSRAEREAAERMRSELEAELGLSRSA